MKIKLCWVIAIEIEKLKLKLDYDRLFEEFVFDDFEIRTNDETTGHWTRQMSWKGKKKCVCGNAFEWQHALSLSLILSLCVFSLWIFSHLIENRLYAKVFTQSKMLEIVWILSEEKEDELVDDGWKCRQSTWTDAFARACCLCLFLPFFRFKCAKECFSLDWESKVHLKQKRLSVDRVQTNTHARHPKVYLSVRIIVSHFFLYQSSGFACSMRNFSLSYKKY